MTTLKQRSNMNPVEYSQFLWKKKLNFGSIYNDSMLKGIFIEHLQGSTRTSMHSYWGTQNTAPLQKLAHYLMSLRSLKYGSALPATTSFPMQMQGCLGGKRYCSNQRVIVTDASATKTLGHLRTNTNRVMAMNNGSTSTRWNYTKHNNQQHSVMGYGRSQPLLPMR